MFLLNKFMSLVYITQRFSDPNFDRQNVLNHLSITFNLLTTFVPLIVVLIIGKWILFVSLLSVSSWVWFSWRMVKTYTIKSIDFDLLESRYQEITKVQRVGNFLLGVFFLLLTIAIFFFEVVFMYSLIL